MKQDRAMRDDTTRSRGAGRLIAALFVAAIVSACASDKDDTTLVDQPVEKLYNDATDALLDGNYAQASKLFEEVDRQHPYSNWATKAELMSAYANYQANKYDEAISGFDRFIQLHPGNRDAPYAYYMRGLCYYEQIADVERDQDMTQKALAGLDEVVKRYPDSPYARDARIKIDLTHDHLAGKEMEVGRYYLNQGQYVAAINRFKIVVDRYQTTTHVPEALTRLTEAYTAVGLPDEAKKTASVLGYNYPGSNWYVDSYALVTGESKAAIARGEPPPGSGVVEKREGGRSWLARAWDTIF